MKALVLDDKGVRLEPRYPRPTPADGEALVAVRLAGICATDLEMARGYVAGFKGVLGHEFVGEVAQATESSWIGQRVVGSINIGCGSCDFCRRDIPEHCPRRLVPGIHNYDGVFAEYVVFPLRNLYPVPDRVPDEEAVFTEPLAAAVRVIEQVSISPGARAAVLGPGRLGLLVGRVLALHGAQVTMLGRRAASLALPASWELATGIAAEMEPAQFDLVVDTTGNSAGLAEGQRLIRPLGTLVIKSTFAAHQPVDLTPLVVNEVQVVGSRCGPFPPALRLLADNAVAVTDLISATYSLDQAVEAFAYAARPGVLKVIIRP